MYQGTLCCVSHTCIPRSLHCQWSQLLIVFPIYSVRWYLQFSSLHEVMSSAQNGHSAGSSQRWLQISFLTSEMKPCSRRLLYVLTAAIRPQITVCHWWWCEACAWQCCLASSPVSLALAMWCISSPLSLCAHSSAAYITSLYVVQASVHVLLITTCTSSTLLLCSTAHAHHELQTRIYQ